MAPKSHFHVRSNSFPSKSHPLIQQCYDDLERLGSSIATSSSSISHKLSGLEDLHESVEKLLQLQFTQQVFIQSREEKWVDEIVDASLRLLDMCTAAKDAVLHTKECTRHIQSIIRTLRPRGLCLQNELAKYSASRKVVKKSINKALKSCNTVEASSINQENETKELVALLQGVEATTLAVFKSLLSFISGSKGQTKLGGWSLVSKLMNNKVNACGESNVANEFAQVDAAFNSLTKTENVKKDMENLDMCVQDFEGRLESLFKRLIKTRVSLLNILNN